MTKDDVICMAREAGLTHDKHWNKARMTTAFMLDFAKLVAAHERDALEAELLKLKKGIAANSEYIQGRWDLIGEFQDAIRARGTT